MRDARACGLFGGGTCARGLFVTRARRGAAEAEEEGGGGSGKSMVLNSCVGSQVCVFVRFSCCRP